VSRHAAHLTIGQLAERSGVATSALRYYESRGLIASERTAGNQRRYRQAMLRRVAFIRSAQRVGLTLDEVEEALATLVEVTFKEARDGGTLVDLLHTGWEVHGDKAEASAASYPEGWALVMERFVNAS